jgi:hypothetical protein
MIDLLDKGDTAARQPVRATVPENGVTNYQALMNQAQERNLAETMMASMPVF